MNDSLLLKIISKKNLLHTTHPKKHNLKKQGVLHTHFDVSLQLENEMVPG